MDKIMVLLEAISKHYANDITALRNINLKVEQGKIFGVIGKSGAGKSTLIRCVNLLERPTSGKVHIDNQEITALDAKSLRQVRQQIGMIFQHFNLLNSKNVYENIAFPLRLAGYSKEKIDHRVNELLALIELADRKDHYPAQLSGGQKQRVGIARALATNPKVLLCDEPTSALDPQTTRSILQLLQEINVKLGITILLITHQMEVIKQVCDEVAVLENGEIIEKANVIDIFSNPKTSAAKQLVHSCLNDDVPDPVQKKLQNDYFENSHPVLRIFFTGTSADQPLMSSLIKNIGLDVNILTANIETLKDEILGVMVLELEGTEQQIQQGMEFLQKANIRIEVLGYVANDD